MSNISLAICGQAVCGKAVCGDVGFNVNAEHVGAADYGENPKINLATGRLVYEHTSLSIGGGTYAMGISLVYNSAQKTKIFPCGMGWKLNVQQKLTLLDGKYKYVDEKGEVNTFVLFDNIDSRYYNTVDAGQVLTVPTEGEVYISDGIGNKIYFNANGSVSKTVSGINANITKVFKYDSNGRLNAIYDSRLKFSDKIRTYLSFGYNEETGLLQSITAYDKYSIIRARELYEYDLTNGTNLIAIKRVAFNANGVEIGQKIVKEFCYYLDGNLKAIADSETRSVSLLKYREGDQVDEICFGVIQDNEIELGMNVDSGSLTAITGYGFRPADSQELLFGGVFVEKAKNSYWYYERDDGYTYKTEVTNEKGQTIVYYLDGKYRIVSSFEKSLTEDNSLKTLNKENGKILIPTEHTALLKHWEKINGSMTYIANQEAFNVYDFDLSHYNKNDNKYFDCSFWLRHLYDEERLKIKFEYKLRGDTAYRTEYVWVNGRAKSAWQKVSVLLTLDESNGMYDSTSLVALRLSLCYASGENAGSFVFSNLVFNPTPRVVTSVRDGTHTFAVNSIDRFYSGAYNTTYEIGNNQTATDTYLTENDILCSLMNKYRSPMNIGSYSYFDIICNDGTKRLSKARGFVFERSGVSCNLTNVSSPMVTETIMPTNKVNVKQYYHFESKQFKLSFNNYYRENGMQGTSSDNDHTTHNEEVYNYKGQKLSETDEYEVSTQYGYDVYGQLIWTKKVGSDGKIGAVAAVEYDENNENVKTTTSGLDSADYSYSSPFALNSETTQNSYSSSTNTYAKTNNRQTVTYNAYNDRITRVARYNGSSLVSQNDIMYENGRIRTVSNGYVKYGAKHDFVNDRMEYTRFSGNTETVVQTDTITRSDIGENHTSTFSAGSDTTLKTTLDKYNRISSVSGNNTVSYEYQNGNESTVAQKLTSIVDGYEDKKTTYKYDHYNNLVGWTKGSDHLKVQQITVGETKYTFGENEKYFTHISYERNAVLSPRLLATGVSRDPNADNDDDLEEIASLRKTYTYDSLGRLKTKVGGQNNENQHYEYLKIGESNTTIPQSGHYSVSYSNQEVYTYSGFSETYEYNKKGHIKKQTQVFSNNTTYYSLPSLSGAKSIEHTKEYQYDELNRITQETISKVENGTTITTTNTYTYGANGKLSSANLNGQLYTVSYNPHDQIMSYKGNMYIYDNMGNRKKKVKNGVSTLYSYTRGNLLSRIGSSYYYYNADGVRYKKEVNDVTTTYYLDGNKILGEDRVDNNGNVKKLRYFYDIDGICGISYNGGVYRVVRNFYGDVVMLVSGTTIIAYYEYDAWGNCKVYNLNGTINAESDFIGNINPFRWKGHYYDVESGLYYANGSYYDPEVGVHVDAASISSIINNAFEVFGLDINGIMCDNILAYLPYVYSAFTTLELMADPEYDPDLNKPWWELAWNAVVNWLISVVQWYNNLDNKIKIGIGLTLFALACIIKAIIGGVGGGAAAALKAVGDLMLSFIVGVVSAVAFTAISMAITGDFSLETLGGAVADAIFWGGVFAFVGASVNVIKQLTRNARAMRLAKKGDYDKLAEMFTHNKNADKVILGKWDNGASTSYVARAGKDYTYYQMPTKIWNDIANVPNIDMWEINKAFLNQQISLGKQFYASHIMANAAGAFGKEITYIGISNIIQLYF